MRRAVTMSINGRIGSRLAIGFATLSLLAVAQGSLAVPQALATAAPTATTGVAQQVQFASATVTGTVNPNGGATTYYFEYGPNAVYGTQTSAASAGAGSSGVAVAQALSGLTPNTTYHYRLVALSAGGTVHATDAKFVTAAPPAPAASTGAATAVSSQAATLNGSVNPDGVPTTYYFQYGSTAAYGTNTATQSAGAGTSAQAAAAAVTGLGASATYHFRLVAVSAGGTVVGSDLTFKTSALPDPAVATLGATTVSSATAVLTGTVNPEGIATTYYFQYGTTSHYGRTTATGSAGSGSVSAAVSQSLSGLTDATTYHYRVVATSAGGTEVGNDATFATTRTPTATTGAASSVGTTTATLTGSIDPHGVATSYYFQYGTKSPTTRTPVASAGTVTVAVSAPLSALVPGTKYVYRLVAAVGASTTTGATRSFTTAKIPPGLSLTSTVNPVRAGTNVTFNGQLSGTGVGVRAVVLQVEPYPYTSGFTQLGSAELTSSAGTFSFTLPSLAANTLVRAATVGGSPALVTAAILEKAFVRFSLNVRRHGVSARFSGLVGPAGARVQIQIQRRVRGRWVTVARTAPHRVSTSLAAFARTIGHPHRGRYRVLAHVRDGSLLSARSRVVTLS